MKLSVVEWMMLVIAAILLALMGGYYLGSTRVQELPADPVYTESAESDPPEELSGPTDPVDINTAGVEELTTLPGIGEKRALDIIAYREEHGDFDYVEDLILVPGIGESIVEELLEYAVAGGT